MPYPDRFCQFSLLISLNASLQNKLLHTEASADILLNGSATDSTCQQGNELAFHMWKESNERGIKTSHYCIQCAKLKPDRLKRIVSNKTTVIKKKMNNLNHYSQHKGKIQLYFVLSSTKVVLPTE